MALRYLEDVGYMSIIRHKVHNEIIKEGYSWGQIDGVRGPISKRIYQGLEEVKHLFEDEHHTIEIIDNYQPWDRMFETALEVKLNIK